MNQSELDKRIKYKICPNCGSRDYEKGPHGGLYCKYCSTKLPGNENDSTPALDEIINKRIVDKDFDGALERSKLLIQKDPSNLAYYWQAVLAEFGVIYVRDVDGHTKPTFFNIEYDSSHKDIIKNSKHFKELEKHASSEEELIDYRMNVKELDDVLNALSILVENEQSFDVFISFKSSEELELADGRIIKRETEDKKKAEEVYRYLTKKGYKVFYSPEAIEHNSSTFGKVYEPVILRALQTSQTLLLFGSKESYLSSTWVENEWRRYKYYITIGQKKPDSIIVLYNQQKPAFPSALTRAAMGTIQINSIDYFNVNYINEIEKAITPFVLNRDIGSTKIERREVHKAKRDIQTQTLQGFKQFGGADLNLAKMLKYNVAVDLQKPSSRKRAIETIEELKRQYPESGQVLAYDLLVKLEGSSLDQLPELLSKAADFDGAVACVREIINKADDEAFYKQFLGYTYKVVFNTVKTQKAVGLFAAIKNCRYEDGGKDVRTENLNKLKNKAVEALNGTLFNDVLDCLAISDEQYKNELSRFVRQALAKKKYSEAFTLAERILKLDNSLIEIINIRNLAKRQACTWDEVFVNCKAYSDKTVYSDFEEIVSFTSSDSQVDAYLDGVCDAVINNCNVSAQSEYNDFVDKFLGLYRKAVKRRKIMENIVDLALERGCFDTCNHYCELLLTKDDAPYNAKIYWKMTLCYFKCKDKNALMGLREEIDGCKFFINALNSADEEFSAELAQIRSSQLEAVLNNRAYDLQQNKYKTSQKIGLIVNSAVLAAILVVLTIGIIAYSGVAPLFTNVYNFTFALFGSALYFYIALGILCLLIVACILGYVYVGKMGKYPIGVKVKDGVISLLLVIVLIIPFIVGIPSVSSGLPKKTYITENGAVILLERNQESENFEYTVSKIELPNGVTTVILPEEVDSVKVNAIGANVFEFCKDRVECVVFGKNIAAVEAQAFKDCTALKTVCFGQQTEIVDATAFEGCSNLTIYSEREVAPSGWAFVTDEVKLVLSSQYAGEAIVEGDFSYYLNLSGTATIVKYSGSQTSVTIPSQIEGFKVTGLEGDAFSGTLNSIVIPDGVTFVSARAFSSCNNLTSATLNYNFINVLPSSVRDFKITGDGVFSYKMGRFNNLNSVELSEGFTQISAGMFEGCGGLTSIVIPDSVTSIGDYAFYGCSALSSVTKGGGVNSIGISAFYNCSSLKSITLSSGLTSIGGRAFYGSGLTSVAIPDSVKTIGDYAFYDCNALNGVTIGNGVTSIGNSLFYNCLSLKSVSIGSGVMNVYDKAFYNCSSLTSITIPDGVTGIGDYAFYGCSALNGLKIGDGVKSVGYSAFYNCSSLKSLVIPDSVTSIGNSAFYGCGGLTGVTMGSGVTNIGVNTFYDCSGLTSITIPDSVTGIGDSAFYNCSSLTSIDIPEKVEIIGTYAFYNCSSLKSVSIGSGVKNIGGFAFNGCSSLERITIPFIGANSGVAKSDISNYPLGYLFGTSSYTGSTATEQYYYGSLGELTNSTYYIPSTLKSVTVTGGNIGYGAFYNCSGLESVAIEKDVQSISDMALYGCSSLESLTIPFVGAQAGVTASDINQYPLGYIFGTSSYTGGAAVRQYYYGNNTNNTTNTTYYIPESLSSVTVLGGNILYGAFYNCNGLQSVKIESGANIIGDNAFYNCGGLTCVTIASGVKSIGDSAFYDCGSLTSLTLPDGVTSIGSYALYECASLTSITVPDSVTQIGNYAFYNCSGLESVNIPNGVKSIGTYTFEGCSSLTGVSIPDSVTGIGFSAFSNCSGLTSVKIGKGVTNIGLNAFYRCASLTSITIPDSVISIGSSAFNGCSSLESITIPFVGAAAGVTSSDAYQYPFGYIFGSSSYTGGTATIQQYYGSSTDDTTTTTYYIPTALKSVTVTGGNILHGAFYNCSGLTSITIPDGVESIGARAFERCSGLTSITIPDSVKSIGFIAFEGCSGLTGVYFAGDIAGWCNIEFADVNSNPLNFAKNLYINNQILTQLIIPDGVKSIGDNAFYNCVGLTGANISASVISIGARAFGGCVGLTGVTLGNGVVTIGEGAFYNCSGLTGIDIPDGVVQIGARAFEGCSGLTSVNFGSGLQSIGVYAFGSCAKLTSIAIPDGVRNIDGNTFENCTGLVSVEIPDGVESIGYGAFKGCSSLTSITIPDSVRSIDSHVFSGCSELTSITIPFVGAEAEKSSSDTNQYPFGYIFGTTSYKGGKTTVQKYYGGSLSSATSTTYYLPASLKSVTITGGNILYGAFYDCGGLTNVLLPASVASIHPYAFYNCSGLTNIIIPETVVNIGEFAFYRCYNLIEVKDLSTLNITAGSTSNGYVGYYANRVYSEGENNLSTDEKGYIIYDDGTDKILVGYSGQETQLTIPNGITKIQQYTFLNRDDLTSVTIPESVKSIGSSAFEGCLSLESITIPFLGSNKDGTQNTHFGYVFGANSYSANSSYVPNSLKTVVITGGTSIGAYAFDSCSGLTNVTIPDGVLSIGECAFYGCSGLTGITVPNSVISIGVSAFYGCSGLNGATIGSGVESIGASAFSGCSSLASITLPFIGMNKYGTGDTHFGAIFGAGAYSENGTYVPTSLKTVVITGGPSISSYAFYNCSGLNNITIPNGVTNIGDYSFYNCSGLSSLTVPDSVTQIGVSALRGCISLSSLSLGSGVESICDYALAECRGLNEVTIGKGVTSIGAYAFYRCSGLTSVTIGSGVKQIGASAFNECNNLTSIKYSGDLSGWCAISGLGNVTSSSRTVYINGNRVEGDLVIPDGVTSIGDYAFYGCSGITGVTIPNSVTSIGAYAFYGCSSLESITLPFVGATSSGTENTHFGYIFGADSYGRNSSYVPATLKTVAITGATSIADYAFYSCSDLANITLGGKVTGIGNYAFYDCGGLTSIAIGSNVTGIGASAFSNCSKLTGMDIPDSVIQIGNHAFFNCSGLTGVTLGGGITIIGTSVFNGCSGLTGITIPASVESIGDSAFFNCSGLAAVALGGVKSLGDSAFSGCGGLKNLTIPDSVTSIGTSAFSNCSGLTDVALGSGVESLGDYAFAGCNGLTSITIPANVTNVGYSAFFGCTAMESISLPFTGATYNGTENTHFGYIFGADTYGKNNSYVPASLKTVAIKGGTSLGDNAFYGCSSLTSVTLPANVTSIGSSAFSNCSGLTSLTIPANVTSIGSSAFSNCSGLNNVIIPNSVTSIGISAFSDCSSLESMTLPFIGASKGLISNTHFGYIFGAISYTDNNSCVPTSLKTVVITGGTIIFNNAFYGCSSLTSITLPASVTRIGNSAFYNCSGLTGISIPDNLTSILDYAFAGCSGLTGITVPNSVTSIGASAFSGCSSLESITLPFVGATNSGIEDTYFGYIFGASSYADNNSYVPATLKTVAITGGTAIGDYAFYNCNALTSITLPASVLSIGAYAFNNCSSLINIIIPDNVTSIGDSALGGCSSLQDITIPFVGAKAGVTSSDTNQYPFGYIFGTASYDGGTETKQYYYGSSTSIATNTAYYIPTKLKSVTITGGNILRGAFYNCNGLTSITLPASVTSIGAYAFYNCNGLTGITLPASVLSVGAYAFYGCNGLTGITLPASVTSIGAYAFYGCSGLTGITLPASVTSIGAYAFYGCNGLTGIDIPNGVTEIAARAFYGCSGLTSVTISDSVTSIGDSAFYDCVGLTSITLSNKLKSIGDYAFSNCSGLTDITIPNGVTTIGSYAFYECSGLNSIAIPDSVTSIGGYIFYNCSNLKSVTIGSGVKSIGNSAFYNCKGLNSVIIPDSVINMGNSVFYGCSGLTSATIGSKVTSIDNNAFYYCLNLANVTIGNGVTTIGNYAFYRCSSLTSITIPDSVTSIGERAFLYCSCLTSVSIGNGVTSIGERAFGGCSGLTSVTLGSSVESIGDYAFSGCSVLKGITIPNSVTTIGSYAFSSCRGLTSVSIGNGVKSIGEDAFYNCTGLTSLSIPDSVVSIGSSAFSGCSGLTSIDLPNSVTSIGAYAFYNCSGLKNVTIPNSVESIGDYAFYNCSGLKGVYITDMAAWCNISFGNATANPLGYAHNLYLNGTLVTSVTIPNSVTSIGAYAFYNCSSLKSVTIPNSVTSIGAYAFYNCNSLTSATFINTNGWRYSYSSNATSGTSISSSNLTNTSTAATYLRSTYNNYYWKRS